MIDRLSSVISIPVGFVGAFTLSRWFPLPELAFAVLVGMIFGRTINRHCKALLCEWRAKRTVEELRHDPHARATAEDAWRGKR